MSDVTHFNQQDLISGFSESFQTKEPDEFQERISTFAPSAIVTKSAPGDFVAASKAVRTPEIALFNNKVSNMRVQWAPEADYVSTTFPLDGISEVVSEGAVHHLGIGKAHVQQPEMPFDFRSSEAHTVTVLNLSRQLVRRTMRDLDNEHEADFSRLLTVLDLKREESAAYFRLATFFWSEFFRTPAYLTSPKMTEHMENTLATAFVLAAYDIDPDKRGQDSSLKPKFVDAALDLMHANLDCPLTLAQLSATVGINARTLTRAFLRAHRVVGYHRRLRLERSNLELIAASAAETSVTDVAMKYGFYQLSHFAAAYKATFGETPSETLR